MSCFLCLCKIPPLRDVSPVPRRETLLKIGSLHPRSLSDVPRSLPLCGQTQLRAQNLGGSWWLIPSPVCFQHLGELCAQDSVSASNQCPEELKGPRSLEILLLGLWHTVPYLSPFALGVPAIDTPCTPKQGKGQLCTLQHLLQLGRAGWLPEG